MCGCGTDLGREQTRFEKERACWEALHMAPRLSSSTWARAGQGQPS